LTFADIFAAHVSNVVNVSTFLSEIKNKYLATINLLGGAIFVATGGITFHLGYRDHIGKVDS
jgi:hypothetical protein